jgi:hypothetical protein
MTYTDDTLITYKGDEVRVADLPAHLRRYYLRPEVTVGSPKMGAIASATARSMAHAADAS